MKFLRSYLKKNNILSVHVKDKSCNSPEGLQLYLKESPTWVFSCEYSKSFRNSFFIEQHLWLLLNYVLISLFHLQVPEPTSRSTTTRAHVFFAKFAEFYYHKIFEAISR